MMENLNIHNYLHLHVVFLSPSDKNSVPERGFSIKKFLLNVYGPSIKEATIISVRLVKDELFRVGDVMKVEINIEI